MTQYQQKYRVESARLKGWDYRQRGWYFVTMCAQNHVCIFGEVVGGEVQLSRVGLIAELEMQSLHNHYHNVQVDELVVMPNHVHAIIMIDRAHDFSPTAKMSCPFKSADSAFASPKGGSLAAIIRSYKSGVSRRCHELGLNIAWQTRFHDHLLRGDKVIDAVCEYIRNNPANWGVDRENPFRPHS